MSRILLLNENVARGGVDTFIGDLITHWPRSEDLFTVLINANHPGTEELKARLGEKISFQTYHGTFVWDFWGCKVPVAGLAKLFRLIFQYPLFLLHFFKIRRRLLAIDHDVLFVVNGGYPGGDLCRAAIIASRKPVIHSVHNLAGAIQRVRYPFEKLIDACISSHKSVTTVSVSKACARSLMDRLPVNSKVILNGIDLQDARSGKKRTSLNCAVVGSLDPRKGQLPFLSSFARILQRCPRAQLLIFGEGDAKYKTDLILESQRLKIDKNVQFLGFRKDKNQIFDDVDVLVVPSQEYESFGLVAIEAMIRGIPVVCSDVGGLPEVVEDKVSGFVIPRDDIIGFADKTCLLLEQVELREQMGQKGIERVRQSFNIKKMCQEYSQLVSDLAAEGSKNGK